MMNVAVLGSSNKPERYSQHAVRLLKEKGHAPYPVHPALSSIDGIPGSSSLRNIPAPIDTISVYLSSANQACVEEDILRSGARRVIFTRGTEDGNVGSPESTDDMSVLFWGAESYLL